MFHDLLYKQFEEIVYRNLEVRRFIPSAVRQKEKLPPPPRVYLQRFPNASLDS